MKLSYMKSNIIFVQKKSFGDGDGGNGDGNDGDKVTLSKSEFEALQGSVKKLESKNNELLGENKTFKEQMKAWDGLDPNSVRSLLQNFENDEEKKLIAEGKFEDVVKKRTEKVSAEFGGKLKTLETERDTYKTQAEQYQATISNMAIDSQIVENFVKEKGLESGIQDIKLRAKQIWRYENGELIPRNEKGEIIQGEKGVLTPQEWVKSLQKDAPHLFPESVSGDTGGNRGKGGNSIDDKISAARKAGNVTEYRRLLAIKNKTAE